MVVHGGKGGKPFEDPPSKSDLTAIRIRARGYIDSLQCVYKDDTQTEYHGGNGGDDYLFSLDDDEAIITVYVWAAGYVDAIQFQTTKGRLSEKYGGSGGGLASVERGFKDGKERALAGFKGSAEEYVDRIDFIWSDTRDLGPNLVTVGDFRGGNGGTPFDMMTIVNDPEKTALTQIIVRSAGRVDAIECKFSNGKSSGKKGGDGGQESVFDLAADERIIAIEGRAGNRIDRLQFVTSKNRRSPMYGGTGGRPFIWKRPNKGGDTASDANMCLLAFQGRAAGEVDRLAPIWCIDPPVKFELDFKSFDKSVDPKAVKMEEVKTYNQDHKNGLSTPRPEEVTWTYSVEKSTTITLSEESRHAIGGKYGIETSVEGSAGVPVLGQVTAKTTVGWQVNTDHSWGGSKTDGKTEHKTDTTSFKETITIAPKTRAIGVGMSSLAKVTGLKWTGTLTVTYGGGSKKKYNVDGTFDSATSTVIKTKWTEEPWDGEDDKAEDGAKKDDTKKDDAKDGDKSKGLLGGFLG